MTETLNLEGPELELEADRPPPLAAGEQEPYRLRSAQVADVSFPERTIELIVVPYETETLVPHPRDRSRLITELFTRGAFDGIQARRTTVKVNREHRADQTVGVARRFHPSRHEGLVAEVYVSDTPLGNETLTLAADGALDASAAYRPMRGGDEWLDRSTMRVRKAWLGHIALVADPAYADAKVLAVRSTLEPAPAPVVARPNLEAYRMMQLEDRYAGLDVRYARP